MYQWPFTIIIDAFYMIPDDKTPKTSDFLCKSRSPRLHCIFVFNKVQ